MKIEEYKSVTGKDVAALELEGIELAATVNEHGSVKRLELTDKQGRKITLEGDYSSIAVRIPKPPPTCKAFVLEAPGLRAVFFSRYNAEDRVHIYEGAKLREIDVPARSDGEPLERTADGHGGPEDEPED